jgi:hypothetical protein
VCYTISCNLMIQSEHIQVNSAQPESLKYIQSIIYSAKGKIAYFVGSFFHVRVLLCTTAKD